MTIGLFDRSGSLIRVTTIGPSGSFGLSMTVTPHTLTSDCFGSWTMTVTWHTFSLGRFGPLSTITSHTCFSETIATLPGRWDLAHAIRLGIKPFAELGANSEALSGSQVDSPCSCRAIFESAPVAMLQSRKSPGLGPRFCPLCKSAAADALRGTARQASEKDQGGRTKAKRELSRSKKVL